MTDFMTFVKNRRTYYSINKAITVPPERIEAIVYDAVKHCPSSFNAQSSRVIVLFGEEHAKLWQITENELRKIVPADNFAPTEQKLAAFASGYGTILFFEDIAVVQGLQAQFPLYKDNFPVWSQHASGMLQFAVWTALTAEGLGASLQHYSPLIDEPVKATWHTPDSWKLIAQMPFGNPTAEPGPKEFQPLEDRVKIYK